MSAETLRRAADDGGISEQPEVPVDPERAAYVAGLRALADLLEANPDLVLPFDGRTHPISVFARTGDDQRTALAAWVRALPGRKDKRETGTGGRIFEVAGSLRGLRVSVMADRDEVCERVVVGTREITETVPDPELVAAVPTVTVTRTEEIVDWVCHPVLDDRSVP